MLTLQQFQINDYLINLRKIDDEHCIISVIEEKTNKEQKIELNSKTMRKLIEIIKNSPFIFSHANNEK